MIKNCTYGFARGVGFNALTRYFKRGRLLVLCYHGVLRDDPPNDGRGHMAVSCSQFEMQLRSLRRAWTPIALSDVVDACEHGRALPPNAVLITFDDGFRNNVQYAAPILERHGFPAVFFVVSGLIGTNRMLWTQELTERIMASTGRTLNAPGGDQIELPDRPRDRNSAAAKIVAQCKRLPNEARVEYCKGLVNGDLSPTERWQRELYEFMSWDEVRALSRRGFDIGAHTVDHPILTSLRPDALRQQLVTCKRTIEARLEQPCEAIAYPNGGPEDFSEDVMQAARQAGFRVGFSLCEGRSHDFSEPLAIDRICVARDMSIGLFQARTAGWR